MVLAASLYGCSSAEETDTSPEAQPSARSTAAAAGSATPAPADDAASSAAGHVPAAGEDGEGGAAPRIEAPSEPGAPAVVQDAGTGEEERSTVAVVALDEPAPAAEGLEVSIASAKPVEAEGLGPGGMSGPAIAVVVSVRNTTDATIATLGSSVTAAYGPEEQPADFSPQADDGRLPSEVAPGEAVSGTYTFLVPEDQREDVVITVSYRPTDPAAVFAGSALEIGADR